MSKDGFALLPCINMTDRCPVYKRLVAISQIIDGELPSASLKEESQTTAVQQLQAKIAALIPAVGSIQVNSDNAPKVIVIMERLRQLSAVQ